MFEDTPAPFDNTPKKSPLPKSYTLTFTQEQKCYIEACILYATAAAGFGGVGSDEIEISKATLKYWDAAYPETFRELFIIFCCTRT